MSTKEKRDELYRAEKRAREIKEEQERMLQAEAERHEYLEQQSYISSSNSDEISGSTLL